MACAPVGKPCLQLYGDYVSAEPATFNPRRLYWIEIVCPRCNARVGKGMRRNDMLRNTHIEEVLINKDLGSRLHVHLRDHCKEHQILAECLQLVSTTKAIWHDEDNMPMHPEEALGYEKQLAEKSKVYVFLFVICEKRAVKLYFV